MFRTSIFKIIYLARYLHFLICGLVFNFEKSSTILSLKIASLTFSLFCSSRIPVWELLNLFPCMSLNYFFIYSVSTVVYRNSSVAFYNSLTIHLFPVQSSCHGIFLKTVYEYISHLLVVSTWFYFMISYLLVLLWLLFFPSLRTLNTFSHL